MGRHTVLALSFVLLFTGSTVYARSSAPEQALPFKIYGQQMIVVQGSIGKLRTRNFVVDTGAYPSVIDRDIARMLSLSGEREDLDAVDRTVSSVAVTVPEIEVGPIHATKLRSLVQDLSEVSMRIGVRIDGLIGLDVLAHSSFRIDYGDKKIFFGTMDRLPSTIPFHLANAKLCVDLEAGPKSVRLLVDTGAEKVVLLGSHVPWIPRSERARAFTTLGGSFVLQEVRLDELQLGDTNLNSEPIYLSAREMPIFSFDGFLSTIQFSQVAFDFERGEFGWMTKDQRRGHVHVASKTTSSPGYAAAIAKEVTKPGSSAVPSQGCGDAATGLACGLR
jgi:predicted aspartyl protease